MKEIQMEGKTVTMAVEKGLRELGLRRDQVEVQVLEENSAGFLGLGGKPARVLIREKVYDPDAPHRPDAPPPAREAGALRGQQPQQRRPAAEAQPRRQPARAEAPRRRAPAEDVVVDKEKACTAAGQVLAEIFPLMGVPAKASCRWDEAQERVRADVQSEDEELLIGQEGRVIEALQFLVTIITGRRVGVPVAVQVEIAEYWQDKEARVLAQVQQAVTEVKRSGRAFRLDPMEPAIRRLIHRSLASNPDVETSSEGEGSWRKVVIRPRRK